MPFPVPLHIININLVRVLQIPEITAYHVDADMSGRIYTPPPNDAKDVKSRPFPCPRRKMGIYYRTLVDRHLCKSYFNKTELIGRKRGLNDGSVADKKCKLEIE